MSKVIKQGPGIEALPPAGHERDELLRERTDELQEAAELRAVEQEIERIDPSAFEIENELAQYFDELEVQNQESDQAYCWVQTGGNGRFIQRKLALGWRVVQGSDKEAAALKGVDTTRRLGDVLLMKISKDRKALLDQREAYKKAQMDHSIGSNLEALAERHGTRATAIEGVDAVNAGRMLAQAQGRQVAGKMMDNWMREGRVPGAQIQR